MVQALQVSNMVIADAALIWSLAKAHLFRSICSTGTLTATQAVLGLGPISYTPEDLEHGWVVINQIFESTLGIITTMSNTGIPANTFSALSINSLTRLWTGDQARALTAQYFLAAELLNFLTQNFVRPQPGPSASSAYNGGGAHQNISGLASDPSRGPHHQQLFGLFSSGSNGTDILQANAVIEMYQLIKGRRNWDITNESMVGRIEPFLFINLAIVSFHYAKCGFTPAYRDEGLGLIRNTFMYNSDMHSVLTPRMNAELTPLYSCFPQDTPAATPASTDSSASSPVNTPDSSVVFTNMFDMLGFGNSPRSS